MSSKRKHGASDTPGKVSKKLKIQPDAQDGQQSFDDLADAIVEDSQNYNKITDLLKIAKRKDETSGDASAALCKVFSSLWIQGRLKRSHGQSKESKQVVDWLLGRYSDYIAVMTRNIADSDRSQLQISLAYGIRLVRAEVESNPELMSNLWQRGTFYELLSKGVWSSATDVASEAFVDSYAAKYEDVRNLLLRAMIHTIDQSVEVDQEMLDRFISILARLGEAALEQPPDPGDTALLFTTKRHFKKDELKRRTGDAWIFVMRQPLTRDQRRRLLDLIPTQIEPSVARPELLLDFLTSCCDSGGTEAIMALNGLYRLIADHGLDYPLLYHKLYALLDIQSLHKKQRSRFLRLVTKFLSSTHLPAVLVASFVKRLSRLALYGPPAAIVAIAPLIYNIMQEHPACTPMLHRAWRGQKDGAVVDPFDAEEEDPNHTNAIDSSLWELDSLRSHWHPNVATIAKILAEQFLKRSYNLEDFLDHSYGSLIDTEVSKSIVKHPALEYHIPKRIFVHDTDENDGGLMKLWLLD